MPACSHRWSPTPSIRSPLRESPSRSARSWPTAATGAHRRSPRSAPPGSRFSYPTANRHRSTPRRARPRQGEQARRIEAILATEQGAALYRRRQQIVEPIFAQTKVAATDGPLPAPWAWGLPGRVAAHRRHPQPAQALALGLDHRPGLSLRQTGLDRNARPPQPGRPSLPRRSNTFVRQPLASRFALPAPACRPGRAGCPDDPGSGDGLVGRIRIPTPGWRRSLCLSPSRGDPCARGDGVRSTAPCRVP